MTVLLAVPGQWSLPRQRQAAARDQEVGTVAEVRDNWVFLTGAADGLGRSVAQELARIGMKLALFDILGDELQELERCPRTERRCIRT